LRRIAATVVDGPLRDDVELVEGSGERLERMLALE
jgi:hypothetical protein